ncbi:MAG TPA: SDR family NAD(P)-dependent oxidoreductase [Caulobacteraceae bacterium]
MAEPSPRRLALITGASAGIGAAFARAYAARGFDLALVARRRDRLETLASRLSHEHGVEAFAVAADLSIDEAHRPILEAVEGRGRHVDALVNNAGFGIPRYFTDAPWREQRDFLMTMAVAPCALAYAVIPGMAARRWGRIINVSSIAGFAPGVAANTLYPGVKGLMIRFSQALDAEYRAQGLKVTAICPGTTKTDFAAEAGYQHLADRYPSPFAQTAEQVAEIAVKGNEAGRVVVIPGWHNRVAVALMRLFPEPLVRSLINAGAAKYRLKD